MKPLPQKDMNVKSINKTMNCSAIASDLDLFVSDLTYLVLTLISWSVKQRCCRYAAALALTWLLGWLR